MIHVKEVGRWVATVCVILIVGCSPESPTSAIYVTDNRAEFTPEKAVKAVSNRTNCVAVVVLSNPKTNEEMTATFHLQDPSAQEVNLSDPTLRFTPTGSSWNVWYTYVPEPGKPQQAGTWKWIVEISGQKPLSKAFEVLSPSPGELKGMARYQKAVDLAFSAFAYYWVAMDDYVVTREVPTERNPAPSTILWQWKDVHYRLSEGSVGEVDSLNGITYRAMIQIYGRLWRNFSEQDGWSDWVENSGYVNLASVHITERDGNWFGESYGRPTGADYGGKFMNGKRTADKKSAISAMLDHEAVARLVKSGKNMRREELKALAEALRMAPPLLPQTQIKTVEKLREMPRHFVDF